MYDCRKTREFLDLYLDNELEAVPTKRVAAHLDECASCRRELEVMRSQKEMLARSIRETGYDTRALRASIEAATFRRRLIRFPELAFPRVPAWAIASVCALVIALAALFYLPGRINLTSANSLYRAAAADHRMCSAEREAPDWIRSQPAITEMAASFLNNAQHIPLLIGGDYRLDRARICQLNGERFLHLVYETPDGREASLFVCHHVGAIPAGERTVTLDSHTLQLAHASDLNVAST